MWPGNASTGSRLQSQWTENVDDVLTSDVDVIVELVGGLHPAYEWVRAALLAGKSVVTANKQLIAHYGAELGDLARVRGAQLRFEASVAGGIPVLRALQEGLAGDRLVEVRGILNGTCAYILSRMQTAELPFAEALAEAQAAGFAEADPTEDVDGADAAAKLAIIAAVGLRRPVRVGDITKQSIRPIDIVDFQYAREIGCTIRQIARAAVQDDGRVFAVVSPALVPLNSSYGRIDGSQNVVTVRGVFGGETSFSGYGAGGAPTAVAVVSDLLSIRRQTMSSAARGFSGDGIGRGDRCTRYRTTSSRPTTSGSSSPIAPASSPTSSPCSRGTTSTSTRSSSCRATGRIACRLWRRSRPVRRPS